MTNQAYFVGAMDALAAIATALNKSADAENFAATSSRVKKATVEKLWGDSGLFLDGVGSNHSALAAQYIRR